MLLGMLTIAGRQTSTSVCKSLPSQTQQCDCLVCVWGGGGGTRTFLSDVDVLLYTCLHAPADLLHLLVASDYSKVWCDTAAGGSHSTCTQHANYGNEQGPQ